MKIIESDLEPSKLIEHIVSGGVSNTNGMPLIIFLKDSTVLKFTFHFKTDYDLALERHNIPTKQWQGINGILVNNALQEHVPEPNGLGKVFNTTVINGKIKELHKKFLDLGDKTPVYINSYLNFCVQELDAESAYDSLTVIQMEEYYGFLSNIYRSPHVSGFYQPMVLGALFEVIYFYFKIKKYLPSFRHNDLHMENIMIHPVEKIESLKYNKFMNDTGEIFYVPYFGYELKIIDLGLSEIPELGIMSVLDNTSAVNKTIGHGLETKLLLRFITLDPEISDILSEEYINEGIDLRAKIFNKFRSNDHSQDPRDLLVHREYHW